VTQRAPKKSANRRDILAGILNLSWIAPLLIALAQMVRFLRFYPPDSAPSKIALGQPGAILSFPVYLEQGRVWLMKDQGGLYALDAVCTHLGCIIGQGKSGAAFECPCHGSRFAIDGAVANGPATQPLRHLGLARGDDGQIVVDRSRLVDAAFRLPLT
jgi:cytochrome b6-f complex iron-sulfur subunit